jgi:transposase
VGINFPPAMKKPQLLQLTKSVRTGKHYLVDDIFKENGHDALHLPLYHPDLNPIRLVWRDIKNRAAQERLSMNLKEEQTFCENICQMHKRKMAKLLLPREEDSRGILAARWLNG